MDNNQKALAAALNWYLDNGVDEALRETLERPAPDLPVPDMAPVRIETTPAPAISLLGKSDAREAAIKLAAQAGTLDELRQAIAEFDGIAIRKTATNLVFCDGNPESTIMLVGEAPGADEDKQGKPFVGISGQLLDRILKCIDLSRSEADSKRSVYISNILNWRPPGNRTPSPAEVEVSLPFIERHIALVNPKILILCGGVSAKALLASNDGISKLRKSWRTYKTLTPGIGGGVAIPTIATYHPAYLLRTPSQKKAVWEDMLNIDAKRTELGLK